MILECDIGNTRCAWRQLSVNGSVIARGIFPYSEKGFSELEALDGVKIVRALSVATDQVVEAFVRMIRSAFGVEPKLAVSQKVCGGVSNAYENATQLGVDRWSALVAAYHRVSGAVLVVDAGSALTVDAVDDCGCHLGGYIVPGLSLMTASLVQKTAGVRFDAGVVIAGLGFGRDTGSAVNTGAVAAELGVVFAAVKEAEKRMPNGFSLILTGGDAELLSSHLEESHGYVAELVLDGLRWLLPCDFDC